MSTTAAALKGGGAKPATSAPKGDAPADPKNEPKKKSKKKLIIAVVVVLVLIVGYEAKSMLMKTTYKPGQKVPNGKIVALDQLTLNLSDGHLVQASISLQLTKVASAGTITTDLPKFEDAAITIFGEQTYNGLLQPATRATVKAELLTKFQSIAGTTDGAAQQISAIYYTGFILQ